MSELFKEIKATAVETHTIPIPVRIAGLAIIITRCVGLLLLFSTLGYDGMLDFVHRSVQAWDSTLIFIASQLIVCLEIHCAFRLMRGENRGRWGYLLAQIVVCSYLMMASMGWIWPEIFSLSGDSNGEIFSALFWHKFPDLLVILLLFMPASSRLFFRARGE